MLKDRPITVSHPSALGDAGKRTRRASGRPRQRDQCRQSPAPRRPDGPAPRVRLAPTPPSPQAVEAQPNHDQRQQRTDRVQVKVPRRLGAGQGGRSPCTSPHDEDTILARRIRRTDVAMVPFDPLTGSIMEGPRVLREPGRRLGTARRQQQHQQQWAQGRACSVIRPRHVPEVPHSAIGTGPTRLERRPNAPAALRDGIHHRLRR